MACGSCNSGLKQTYFPLRKGSPSLAPHEQLPGAEQALLIDPGLVDPMEHIVFERQAGRWQAFPRDESPEGDWTIFVFKLNSPDLLGKYTRHTNGLARSARALDELVGSSASPEACAAEWGALVNHVLGADQPFLALTHDWLAAQYPSATRTPWEAVGARPLRRPELWLPGTARGPAVRPPLPVRPSLDGLPDDLQRHIRVARHHRAQERRNAAIATAAVARVDQRTWRDVADEYRQHRPAATAEELSELFDLKVDTTRRYLTSG
jgi:plasmid stability protein